MDKVTDTVRFREKLPVEKKEALQPQVQKIIDAYMAASEPSACSQSMRLTVDGTVYQFLEMDGVIGILDENGIRLFEVDRPETITEKDFRFSGRIGEETRNELRPKVGKIVETLVSEYFPITSPTRNVSGVQIDGEEYAFADITDTPFDHVVRVYDRSGASLFDVKHEALERMKPVQDPPEERDADCASKPAEDEIAVADAEPAGKPEDDSHAEAAIEKLEKALRDAKDKSLAEPVIKFLTGRCRESESLSKDICQDHKTWGKCHDYIFECARKQSNSRSVAIRDDVVYEWAEDYFHLDDKAAEEEKAKKAAEQVKKGKEAAAKKRKEMKKKQQEAKTKPAVQKAEKPVPEKKEEKPKKKGKEIDGQIDLFSLMGM